MGTYDAYNDTPNRLKTEGETITLSFQEGVPAVGQGTVTWNIPDPGTDNVPGNKDGAYAGIIIVLSVNPLNTHTIPKEGRIYTPDPTANPKLHSGDKIGSALVVGAFYEKVKVAQGKPLTTTFIINDLQPNTSYYVGAYAVDAQFRYHYDGVRAYSDRLAGPRGTDVPAKQFVKLGNTNEGRPVRVLPSDGTGLIPGINYQFDFLLDNQFPSRRAERKYRITVNGSDALTYCDFIAELNRRFALIYCPPVSPVSPGTNELYWDAATQQLFKLTYDPITQALTLELIPNVIVQATDPTYVPDGTYWYDTLTKQLFLRTGSPGMWSLVNVINFGGVNPTALNCDDYWFNNSTGNFQGYVWNGTAWCETPTIVSGTDPACPPTDLCGAFWYDTAHSTLYNYNVDTKTWDVRSAIVWPNAPNMLPVGTYWYDLTPGAVTPLHQLSGSPSAFTALPNTIVSTTPPTVAPGFYWFNPSTEILQQFNGTNFVPLDVLVWPGDPTVVSSCELWWDTIGSPNELRVWDVVNNQWTPVAKLFDQTSDPSLAPTIEVGTLWYNSITGAVLRWDGASWVPINVAINPYDPANPFTGDAWLDPVTHIWYIFNGTSWQPISPIISEFDPTQLPVGTYWYDTANNTLSIWNGTMWVNVAFTTTPPFPRKSQMWFNSSNGILYRWDGEKWQRIMPAVIASLDPRGYLTFTTSERGSGMHFMILMPGGTQEIGTGAADFAAESIPVGGIYDLEGDLSSPLSVDSHHVEEFVYSSVTPDAYVFNHLIQGAVLRPEILGADAVSDVPSYMELGVGTDGTPDERRNLADTIRLQLGYPAVDVELDKRQIDKCIDFALTQFRQKSSTAYQRAFFFLDIQPRKQKYILTNKQLGYNKIVNITAIQRFTSAFLATAQGAGAYGQMVLQHLYNMGTYDLSSYYLVSNYVETLEIMFASRLTYSFDEHNRMLHIYNSFNVHERALMDCTIERTEQELLKNRLAINWIREWALSEAMLMLSQIRGKFGSLPGAGGGVTLNASELRDRAEKIQEKLLAELDDYQVNEVEQLGYQSQFVIG